MPAPAPASSAASVLWQELSYEDLNALAKRDAIVVLPIASMEQHGPHLPVGVDTILCGHVCREAAEKLAAESLAGEVPVVVAPTLWCGMAEHHMAFGGTFTFDIPTYRAVLLAFLKSIERAGFKRCAIVNGHGGNMSTLNAFLPDFHRELTLDIRATTYFDLAVEKARLHLERQQSVMHACEMETSMMMVYAPATVKHDRLAEAVGPVFQDAKDVLQPKWQRFRSIMELSPNGVLGDARVSDPTKGRALCDACRDALADELRAWRA
jgi:creatinine amidohydrolase